MPPEEVTIVCPKCAHVYRDWYRASMNLDLDAFDETYIDEASSAVCPRCSYKVYFDSLIVRDGDFELGDDDEDTDEGSASDEDRSSAPGTP